MLFRSQFGVEPWLFLGLFSYRDTMSHTCITAAVTAAEHINFNWNALQLVYAVVNDTQLER